VLEYLHTPHDLPLAPNHQLLLAEAKMKDKDLEEGTPDHPGEPLETAEVNGDSSVARAPSPAVASGQGNVVQAAMRQSETVSSKSGAASPYHESQQESASSYGALDAADGQRLTTGTVILEVEQGGIEVPSFVGKTVRGAVEAAQDAGLELEAVGSGLARQQSPPAGTHVAAGAHVRVQFGR
jgi:cell division protein FtsI (penicillin-binding protein 3)